MKALRRLLLPGLFFLCLFLSSTASQQIQELPNLYTLIQEERTFTGKEALEMQRKEAMESDPVPFAVWGQESEKPVSNPSLGRTAYPAVLTLCGPSFLLYSSSAPLLTEDTEGCLLDRTTAQELFGTSKAVGNTLNYQNRILTVRGILEGDAPILLLQALPEDSDMSRVSLSIPSGTAPHKFLTEFVNRHGLSGQWSSLRFWSELAHAGTLLAPAVLLLSALFSLLKTTFTALEFPLPFLACLLLCGLSWFLLLWLCEFSFQLPEDFIPTKWSDFEFWSRLWKSKGDELVLLLTSEKLGPELPLFLNSLKAIGFGLLAVFLYPISLPRLSMQQNRGLWGTTVFFLLLAFCSVVFTGTPTFAENKLLWLVPIAYLWQQALSLRLRLWIRCLDKECADTALPAKRRYRIRRL